MFLPYQKKFFFIFTGVFILVFIFSTTYNVLNHSLPPVIPTIAEYQSCRYNNPSCQDYVRTYEQDVVSRAADISLRNFIYTVRVFFNIKKPIISIVTDLISTPYTLGYFLATLPKKFFFEILPHGFLEMLAVLLLYSLQTSLVINLFRTVIQNHDRLPKIIYIFKQTLKLTILYILLFTIAGFIESFGIESKKKIKTTNISYLSKIVVIKTC